MAPRRSRKVQNATRVALTEVARLDTALGQTAMTLASMLDDPTTTSTARVAAAKELRAVLGEATRAATVTADPVDELRAKRERRLAGNA